MPTLIRRVRATLRVTVLRAPLAWYRHREIRPTDVFLAAYPKSGSTWLRFLLGELLLRREMDFDAAKCVIPLVGLHRDAPLLLPGRGRLIKTHERYRPPYKKAIYLVRDARDVAISYYFHQLRQDLFDGECSAFLASFLAGKVDGLGTWNAHVRSWLESPLAEDGQLHVIRYEEMKTDTASVLRAVAGFLGVETTDQLIENAIHANTLSRMREKEKGATVLRVKRNDVPVVRKGQSGEWKDVMTVAERTAFVRDAGPMLGRLGYDVSST